MIQHWTPNAAIDNSETLTASKTLGMDARKDLKDLYDTIVTAGSPLRKSLPVNSMNYLRNLIRGGIRRSPAQDRELGTTKTGTLKATIKI